MTGRSLKRGFCFFFRNFRPETHFDANSKKRSRLMGTLQRFALQALFRVVGFETIGANNGARARRTPLTVRSVVRGVSRSPVARVRPETSRAMRTSSSRPSSRHAARVSALVAIALCAFAPIAVSAAGAFPARRLAAPWATRCARGSTRTVTPGWSSRACTSASTTASPRRTAREARRAEDVGVFAASGGLDAGEAYVSVPWSLVLSAETVGARRPALGALLTQLRAEYGADEKSALMLALLHERFASPEDSPWRDYLAALPAPGDDDGFDATVRWSPASSVSCGARQVLDDAIADQARVRAVHKGFTARVFEANHAGASPFPPRARRSPRRSGRGRSCTRARPACPGRDWRSCPSRT